MFDLEAIDFIIQDAVTRIATRATRKDATSAFVSRDGVPATANNERFHSLRVFPPGEGSKLRAAERELRLTGQARWYERTTVQDKEILDALDREPPGSVSAVYDLREAAVAHGKAVATLERETTPQARDAVLETKLELEVKTAAAIDECGG